MENTTLNKEKFFANYLGQNVYRHGRSPIVYNVDRASMTDVGLSDHLELKSLSDISDEDAIFIHNDKDIKSISHIEVMDDHIRIRRHRDNGYSESWFKITLEIGDFLRSKGYALPFSGLSVEQQIDYGWVKLIKK